MTDITKSAKSTIQEIKNKAFRERMCLWFVILILFAADLAIFIVMAGNHWKL